MKVDKLFQLIWPLAVFALPWQTRWFALSPNIAGWPWEQGRLSFYASWFFILATIFLGTFVRRQDLSVDFKRNSVIAVSLLGLCTVIATPQPIQAAVQWWSQVMLLLLFFITLVRANVSLYTYIGWTIMSIVPHATLAVVQFFSQFVYSSSWLGMSAQNPAVLGVSVVQALSMRVLRAYGGFPHPNILGGWLAFGLVAVIWLLLNFRQIPILTSGSKTKSIYVLEKLLWGIEGLFVVGLFYSFSRSAWIAAAFGMIILAISSIASRSRRVNAGLDNHTSPSVTPEQIGTRNKSMKIRVAFIFILPILLFSCLSFVYWDLVATRTNVTAQVRLEQKSVDARKQSLMDGVRMFQANPFFGTGPNSELIALSQLNGSLLSAAPLEPPHLVWLLMLDDLGVVGVLVFVGFLLMLLRRVLEQWRNVSMDHRMFAISVFIVCFIVSLFDHYLWSAWSGQVLSAICVYIASHIFLNANQNKLA